MVKESGERIFSNLLNTDDGVLASLLRARGLSEMETAVTIDRFIFEVRHELEEYGYCRLGEIGTLRCEPATKVLRLYPPVQGELPKQTPYVPQPIEKVEKAAEPNATKATNGANATSKTPNAPKTSKTPAKPRKKFDLVMVVAIVILVAALAAIAYGWYVSNLGVENDDAAMDALRITPGQTINE